MNGQEQYARMQGARRAFGDGSRTLMIGQSPILIEGLDRSRSAELGRRWGGFLRRTAPAPASVTVRLFCGGPGVWLDEPRPGENYRVELVSAGAERLVSSYHFAIAAGPGPRAWSVAITDDPSEPLERILDNVLRFVVAHLAASSGGFALHAAGVLRDGRAYLFAGPSRAGKSTVLRLLGPETSLGDDLALVLPDGERWSAPALPFDNSERAPAQPPPGLYPVAGIWRLYQSTTTRVERPAPDRAIASLVGCAAQPWTMPELSQALLAQAGSYVARGGFHHLHFTRDAELWSVLV